MQLGTLIKSIAGAMLGIVIDVISYKIIGMTVAEGAPYPAPLVSADPFYLGTDDLLSFGIAAGGWFFFRNSGFGSIFAVALGTLLAIKAYETLVNAHVLNYTLGTAPVTGA